MHPKSQSLLQRLSGHDKRIRSASLIIYEGILSEHVLDLPIEHAVAVMEALCLRDYLWLLDWADSYGSVVHATAADCFAANQLIALIKKYPFPVPGIKHQAQAKALEKFASAEKRCARYNLRFRRVNMLGRSPHSHHLEKMRRWIQYVIGEQPNMRTIYALCDFGPGASLGVHGQATNLKQKFLADSWTVTPLALPYALTALAKDPLVWELFPHPSGFINYDFDFFREEVMKKVRLVHNNKVICVPKTTLVDRTIAVEPLLNGYLQKGVDNYMRQRLKRVGLDLRDQQRNQDLARLGSLPDQTNPFCTIDLSSASDSISTEVVRCLLPPLWFELLNHLRSGVGSVDGTDFLYEKFASMGNGFCFPLETLIFASVCACFEPDSTQFSVYGDDIICRQSVVPQVLKLLRYLGFRENLDKTFITGPFRESCGADWYEGRNVRPLTLDYAIDSVEACFKFHNLTLRHPLWMSYFTTTREGLREVVPSSSRLARPFIGQVDTAFEVTLDEFMVSPFARWCRKTHCWSWVEIIRRSAPDRGLETCERYMTVLMMAALRGSNSDCPFSYRRKTKRSVRRVAHGGSTSLWTPTDHLFTEMIG